MFISTLISDNSRNTIIYFFLLPNLIKPVVATEFFKLEDDKSNQINKLSWSKDPVVLKPKPIKRIGIGAAIRGFGKAFKKGK